ASSSRERTAARDAAAPEARRRRANTEAVSDYWVDARCRRWRATRAISSAMIARMPVASAPSPSGAPGPDSTVATVDATGAAAAVGMGVGGGVGSGLTLVAAATWSSACGLLAAARGAAASPATARDWPVDAYWPLLGGW